MIEGDRHQLLLDAPGMQRWGPLESYQPQNPVPDAQTLDQLIHSSETSKRAEEQLAQHRSEQPPNERLEGFFWEQYKSHSRWAVASAEQGDSRTEIRAFEFYIDPTNQRETRGILVDFGLRAAQLGFRQSLGPLILPGAAFINSRERNRPLTAVYFFLERHEMAA